MIAFAHGCIIETALKRPEARTLEHFLFHFEKFTSSSSRLQHEESQLKKWRVMEMDRMIWSD